MTVLKSAVTKMGNGHLNTVLLDSESNKCSCPQSDSVLRSRYHVSPCTLSIVLCTVILSLGFGVLCLEMYRVGEVWNLQTEVERLKKEVHILKEDFAELEEGEDYVEDFADELEDEEDYYEDRVPEVLNRKRRQAPPGPRLDGVPILEDSYGVDHLNHSSEGLRIYESLVSTRGRGEPRTPGISWKATDAPILPHHKKSPLWVTSSSKNKKYRNAETNPRIGGSNSYLRRARFRSRPTKSPPVLERKSRVKQTGGSAGIYPPPARGPDRDGVAPLKRAAGGNGLIKVNQTPDEASTGGTPGNYDGAGSRRFVRNNKRRRIRRKNKKRKHKKVDEERKILGNIFGGSNLPSEGQTGITAAHFIGDTSNYSLQHEHYEGNGRLRTVDGFFTDWKKSPWMDTLKFTNFYPIDGGTVTIQEPGLYFIYAQVNYLDEHDVNSFEVVVNKEPFLQCTTMTQTTQVTKKANTCFTGGATYLAHGDTVSMKDIESRRYAIITSKRSFFGLVKLSGAKI